jgi:hypothetical protein
MRRTGMIRAWSTGPQPRLGCARLIEERQETLQAALNGCCPKQPSEALMLFACERPVCATRGHSITAHSATPSPSDQAPPMQRAAINQLSNGIALRSRSCIVQRRRTSQKIVTWCPGRESHAITDTTNCCLSFAWWCERSAGWPGPCHAIFPSGRNLASRTPIGRRLFVLGGVG